jgi:DNA-binding MarR family transcriptional regulator
VSRHATGAPPDLHALAEFRYRIRRFLHFSETAAREAGVEPQQHQLLLFAAAAPGGAPSVGELAERLQLRPHSADELVARAEANGLVVRNHSESDRRVVRVELTPRGRRILESLADLHRAELRTAGPGLVEALRSIIETPSAAG